MIQCAVSLIVCNLAVVVTFIYRLFINEENTNHIEVDDMTASNTKKSLSPGSHNGLTHVAVLKLQSTHTAISP
jgi:hypothetical protein